MKQNREAVKRAFNKVSESRHQSSIEILGLHSRLQTTRFVAVAPQIQRQKATHWQLCHNALSDPVNHLLIILRSTALNAERCHCKLHINIIKEEMYQLHVWQSIE
jgi:hypothetical protein